MFNRSNFNKKIFLSISSILVLLLSTNVYGQTSILAKSSQDTILKELPSRDSISLKTISAKSTIKIYSISGQWAYVNYENSYGYVNIDNFKSLENFETQTSQNSSNSQSIIVNQGSSNSKNNTSNQSSTNSQIIVVTQNTNTQNTNTQNTNTQNTNTQNTISNKPNLSDVSLDSWYDIKKLFNKSTVVEVFDIYSEKTYYVKSISNGNHADVETLTKKDTQIMYEIFEKKWSWDVRPIIVTIGDKKIAASINGMPHNISINKDNNMEGHICIHFKDSTTHNGNIEFGKLHQKVLQQAYDLSNNI